MDALDFNNKVIEGLVVLQYAFKIDMDHYYTIMTNLCGNSMDITLPILNQGTTSNAHLFKISPKGRST